MQSTHRLDLRGFWKLEIIRGGLLVAKKEFENVVVNEGKNYAINASIGGGTQDTVWFVGLLDGTASPNSTWTDSDVAANDFTGYSETVLQTYVKNGASTAQLLTNSNNPAEFNINAGGTVGGVFLIGTNSKSPSGTVYAAGSVTNELVAVGDVVRATANFTA